MSDHTKEIVLSEEMEQEFEEMAERKLEKYAEQIDCNSEE